MNKKLLALAIGAAVAMPVAALADGPTLYGKLSLSLENVDDGTTGGTDEWDVANNASRIGVKGAADTGVSGLQGIYLAEFGVKADDGAGPFSARNIYAGLKGDFGTVLIGNIDTPTKSVQGTVDQFNDTTIDMTNYLAGEVRAPNVVAYASPLIADAVTVTVALWQAEGAPLADGNPGESIGDAVSASVTYKQDSLYLGVGMDQEVPNVGGHGYDVAGDNYLDIVRAVVGYNTDSFDVGFLYQTADAADTGSTNSDTSMLLSGAYKTGDWKFKAQYATTKADNIDDTLTMMGIGADYAVGKATTLTAGYATLQDDLTVSATDGTLLSFGIVQNF